PAGVPPPPTFDIYAETFDGGTPACWTFTGLWHASTCRSISPSTSIAYKKTGACSSDYDTGSTNAGEATSPVIDIPAAATYVRLRFGSWFSTEPDSSYDVKTIHVSANGGPFTQVGTEYGAAGIWNALDLDLAAFAGQSVRVKFRFDTLDHLYNYYEGWYVDNVVIAADVAGNPTVPGVPSLTVARGPGVGELSLAWTTPAPGASPILHYTVYRAESASGPFAPLLTSTGTSLADSGLGDGVTRFYRVSATNDAGEGAPSATASGTTFTAPLAPTVTAVAGPGAGELRVDWTAPSNGGTAITHYTVYRANSATGPFVALATTTATTHADAGLGNGETRYYRVSATNAVGEGASSAAAGATTYTVPGAPTSLTASPGGGAGQITLVWTPGPTGGTLSVTYRVYRAAAAEGPFEPIASPTAAAYVDSGHGEGVRYWYRVSAVNVVGEGALSPVADARTFVKPSAPLALDARPGGQLFSIDLVWQPPEDTGSAAISSYRVYRDGMYVGTAGTTSYRDRNLDPTRVYTYEIAAVNVAGEGPKSLGDCARPAPWPVALESTCRISMPS
ncbi:MAG TPA: hypothetical protein VM582_10185, partial [Candidatus Thermoplasmatota archaeon]|nr:hypothetical protein [Candidatus Thermoplasmatota archaeon]